jgi:hypothetical protein
MSITAKMIEVEGQSLKDLAVLVKKSEEWTISMTVIGGYAVRAYTNAYRHTKDIDLAVAKEERGKFIALLKSLSYVTRSTDFGIAASRKFDSDFIDVHISFGRIFDISTGLSYHVDEELFKESRTAVVRPRYAANKQFETKAPIVDLNTLLVLKLMPQGRPEKDSIDIISLILDRVQEISVNDVIKKCERANLKEHISSQIQKFAKAVREGEMGRTWSQVTGTTLTGVRVRSVQKFLRELNKALRA